MISAGVSCQCQRARSTALARGSAGADALRSLVGPAPGGGGTTRDGTRIQRASSLVPGPQSGRVHSRGTGMPKWPGDPPATNVTKCPHLRYMSTSVELERAHTTSAGETIELTNTEKC